MFLNQETPIVAHLIKAVGNVFGQSGGAVLEHQADLRAVERGGIERRIGRGDAEIQAVVWQDAVAQIEPQRARRTGADRDRQIDHVARGPQRVFHADVERDRGGALQRGQIERDAIEAVVEILPAIIERAGDRLIGIGIAEAGGDQDVDDRQARRAWGRRCAGACRTRADRRLDARAWQRHDRAALVGGIAAGDEGFDRGERRDPGRSGGIDGERQFEAARRFGPGAHVIGPQLLDRLFLHRVDEAERAALPFGQRIDTAHHALRTGSDGGAVPKQRAIRRAADFDAIETLARRDGQIVALAAFDIDVPVGQLEIIVAAGQFGAVVDAGPGRLGNAVDALPHPLLEVLGVGEFDFPHAGDGGVEQRRQALVPAVAVQPGGAARCSLRRRGGGGFALVGECGDIGGTEHPVVHPDFVEIAAAHEIVAALHLMRRHHPPGEAELIEPGIEIGDQILARHELAVDVEAHAGRFVPGEGDVLPRIPRWHRVDLPRNPHARQVRVGDEGVEAVAVPVDPQERHVPARMIGEPGAEDDERCLPQRLMRAPEEAERPALAAHVARRLPRDIAVIGPARRAADRAVGHDIDAAAEIGDRIARGDIGGQALVGGHAEQQAGIVLCGGRCSGDQRNQRRAGRCLKAHRSAPAVARAGGSPRPRSDRRCPRPQRSACSCPSSAGCSR